MHVFRLIITLSITSALSSTALAVGCGYGTSEQDCQHQQRDAAANEINNQMAREAGERQMQQAQDGLQTQYVEPAPRANINYTTTYLAVAWHMDAQDVWASWTHRTLEKAEAAALTACNSAMNGDCTIATNVGNGSITVVRDAQGYLSLGTGPTPQAAKAEAMKSCTAAAAGGCKMLRNFRTVGGVEPANWSAQERAIADAHIDLSENYAPTKWVRNSYAVLAWPNSTLPTDSPWRGKVWLMSGSGYSESSRRLLARCQQDSGVACVISNYAANTGVIFQYVRGSTQIPTWWFAPSVKEAQRKMKAQCLKTTEACKYLRAFDAKTARFEVVLEDYPKR